VGERDFPSAERRKAKGKAPLRAAIVGAGLMGHWHARALAPAGAHLVGICDCDVGAARGIARGAPVVIAGDIDELLDRVRPDVLHVCTPAETHAALAQRALETGIHVLVEKPLAPSAAETDRLLALARARGLLLYPVHQLAFQRWLPRVTRLGVLLSVDFAVCSAGASSRPGAEADRVVMDILPHPLSLFERVHPGSLKEISWQVLRPRSGELRASGVSRGTVFTLSISMNGRPPRNELIVTGEEGTLHADLFHGFAVRESPRNSRGYKIARPLALSARHFAAATWNLSRRALRGETAYPGLRALVCSCYAHILDNEALPIPPSHALEVARAREAIGREAGLSP